MWMDPIGSITTTMSSTMRRVRTGFGHGSRRPAPGSARQRVAGRTPDNENLTLPARAGIYELRRGAGFHERRAWGVPMTPDDNRAGSLDGLRVMVIDDSKTIRRTAETLLKREGADVVTATDGFEALAKIADQQPQIIFVDIMMPRLDGYQTCALIKNNQLFKSTPVIMLSSRDGLFDKARGRIVGSEQYVTKPFTREELLDAIRKHVNA